MLYLHCEVAEWLVQLTFGAPTEVIHRVMFVVVHLNSFDCPLVFGDLCGSTTTFVSGRANDGIHRYLGQCSRMGHIIYRSGQSPFYLCLHPFFLFSESLLHHLLPLVLFTLSSSFATSIGVHVLLESKLPRHHPVASAMSRVFWIPERQSELINLSMNLQYARFDIFNFVQYLKCLLM